MERSASRKNPSRPEPPRDRVDTVLAFVQRETPDRDLPGKAVALRMRRAAHYVDTAIGRQLTPAGVDLWELELLATLMRRGGSALIAQLQDYAQLTAGAITNRITRLEKAGFLTREIDTRDRRHILVTLTNAGWLRAEEVLTLNDAAQQSALDRIDPALIKRLAVDLRSFLLAVEGPAPDEDA